MRSAPPRSLQQEYSAICTTHKKLVKSGKISCSISLSESPPKLNLPSAPNSPNQEFPLHQEQSVHWGVVGEHSGHQTPADSSGIRTPVIVSANSGGAASLPLQLRPPPPGSQLVSPSLVQGISSILDTLEPGIDSASQYSQETPTSGKAQCILPRRLSSTDPNLLTSNKIPIVSTSVSSIDSSVFESPVMDDQEQNAKELVHIRKLIVREVEEFTEEDVCASRIPVLERDLSEIKKLKNEYQDKIEEYIEKYANNTTEQAELNKWKKEVTEIATYVKNHAKRIRDKKEELFPTTMPTEMELRSMAIQEQTLKLKQLSIQEKQKAQNTQQLAKQTDNLILAETEANTVLGECSVMGDLIPDEDWAEVEDSDVAEAVRNLEKWQDQWIKVERSYRKYENMALQYKFSEERKEALKAVFDEMKERYQTARDVIKKQDVDRGLFTLDPVRTDIIKYPIFAGAPHEDYLKFKETMDLRFRENKVRKKEQVAKLRECLKGAALGRVPEGLKDIGEAFKRLDDAFGNPNKVMNHNLKALEELGTLPPDRLPTGQPNFTKKIEWFLKLEVILGKIISLSERSSQLAHEAFSSSTYRKLWARFPINMVDKLIKVPGQDGERMQGILNKIVTLREQTQRLDDECGALTGAAVKKNDALPKVTAEIFFKTAQRYDECRVCIHLEGSGQNYPGLFENHLSNYATGCPKFIESSTELRKSLAMKIKLCRQCFHPDVVFTRDHLASCPFSKKKNSYSCLNRNCKEHMWICLPHKAENREAMDRFRRDLHRKGFSLALTSSMSSMPSQQGTQMLNKAVRKIRRVEKKKGAEVVPVPEGEPMFLFHPTKGKTEAVNTFYDSGCSHAVFKQGIPGDQLRGQVVNKGPFQIGGVGGLVTTAYDEWVVSVERVDGKKQLIQGLTVPKITSDFPHTNLEAAIRDIKTDDPDNAALQNCRAPTVAGGTVHMLLGIKYISIFPKEIHTLPCGLTIYESRLASHGGLFNSCIGGPHTSFTALAGEIGGTARLIAHFVEGLQEFRQMGAPKLEYISLREEDVAMAIGYNAKEDSEGEIREYYEEVQETSISETEDLHSCCDHCPTGGQVHVQLQVASDERVKEFKKHQEIHESGLEVLYRCPKCRDCTDCKSADKTERISLREESEMEEIRKSVQLDFRNSRIQCSLPTRGKERDYLTSNRERAVKVLQQQIKKYSNDTATKQTILEAFDKLFKNGHAKLLSELSEEETQFLNKEVQHHLLWRVVFSGSVTTPTRPVMDASARTPFRRDGTGGKSLNDLVCKGKIESLNMVKVLLRFVTGKAAFTGDLRQFYNACKLNCDQWNLQRFLWVENLDPKGEILEAIITTLIYGVTSVSAQSEFAMGELAALVKEENPELAQLLLLSRYVDDLQESKTSQQHCLKLTQQADQLFSKVGLVCKAWTYTGIPPSPSVSHDELSVGIFGAFSWYSEGDFLELRFPKLHFNKPKRGKLPSTVKYFEGDSVEEMEKFVPNPLTKRQAASKVASLWDLLGHLTPIMPLLKILLRETFQRTEDWDSAMPLDLRQRWVEKFLLLERLRGLRFTRAIMPPEAMNSRMRLLTVVDAAKPSLIMGCWGGFELPGNTWSNQLLLGRCLLSKNESIPKSELDALCGGSNMAWVVRLALKDWVQEDYLFGDSMISLCWLTSEKLRLELFHRNRVLQIRRGTDLKNVYYVRTDVNPADCGTRPDKVKVTDVGPNSRWECGESWMQLPIAEAASQGFIKPVSEIRVNKELENDYKEGLMFGDRDEAIMRGNTATSAHSMTEIRVQKLQKRAEYADYLLLPTKFNFASTVRIYGYVLTFIKKAGKGRKFTGIFLKEASLWFSVFPCNVGSILTSPVKVITKVDKDSFKSEIAKHFTVKKLVVNTAQDESKSVLTNNCLHQVFLYLFRKATMEVKKFVSKQVVTKVAREVDGILLSKGRLVDGMNFVETGELGNFNMGSLGIKVNVPVLDRFSPLSYSIAQHVHWQVGKHRGIETTNRLMLEHVSILQGMSLCREIAEECIRCHMKRKKLLEVPMGPISQDQLVLAPPFFITMLDLCGPMKAYVPGYERATRARAALEYKLHIMVAVCVTTKIVNLQVLEGKSADAIIDGFTRLSAEVGIPNMVHVDQDSGALSGFQSVELEYRDLQHRLWTQFGISFSTCPKGGHDQHGLVERAIKSIKETFTDAGLDKQRIHAMGWQTFAKLAENAYNNVPIGYSYARGHDNTELLKILTPNMLRVGRINSRSLQGPIRLPTSKREMLNQVEKVYQGWFRIFRDSVVPRLINQPKWFKVDKDLKEKDLVYFQKVESGLKSEWTVGQVDQVIASRDGLIRRAVIKYFNAGSDNPEFTDRSVRTLVKLWSMDEACLAEDLGELQKRMELVGDKTAAAEQVTVDSGADVQSDLNLPLSRIVTGLAKAGLHPLVAAPAYLVADQLNLTSLTMPCSLTPLHVGFTDQPQEHGVQDAGDQVDQLDTLTSVIQSTGFALD